MEQVFLKATSVVKTFAEKLTVFTTGSVVLHPSSIKRAVVHDVETGALSDPANKNGDQEGTIGFVQLSQFAWFIIL
jgi:hypothetical protein